MLKRLYCDWCCAIGCFHYIKKRSVESIVTFVQTVTKTWVCAPLLPPCWDPPGVAGRTVGSCWPAPLCHSQTAAAANRHKTRPKWEQVNNLHDKMMDPLATNGVGKKESFALPYRRHIWWAFQRWRCQPLRHQPRQPWMCGFSVKKVDKE